MPLQLLVPQLRYREPQRAKQSFPSSAETAQWQPQTSETWTLELAALCLTAQLKRTADGATQLAFSATARRPLQLGLCALRLGWSATQTPSLIDRYYQWRPLEHHVTLSADTPLVLRWAEAPTLMHEIRSLRSGSPYQVKWEHDQVCLTVILDAAALHPRWQFTEAGRRSTAAPLWQAGQMWSTQLQIHSLPPGSKPLPKPTTPARFPAGREAAFVITDHCDFDTTERLQLFLAGDGQTTGWLGNGLRLTKGVFGLKSAEHYQTAAATLQHPDYRALIETLEQDGNEIAPHGLNEVGSVQPEEFQRTLCDWPWPLQTWIDHGSTLAYCYTLGGAEHPAYRLLETLRGVRALWSYHDVPADAAVSLNLLAPDPRILTPMLKLGWQHLLKLRLGIALHYLRSIVRWHTDGALGDFLGTCMSALRRLGMNGMKIAEWQRFGRALGRSISRFIAYNTEEHQPFYERAELLDFAAVLYPERGVSLHHTTSDEPLLFVTGEVLHTRDVYSPAALQRLVLERGLHIGHCYLLNALPYVAGIFQPNRLRLSTEWGAFLTALRTLNEAGKLWNPTLAELAEHWRLSHQIVCQPLGNTTIKLENHAAHVLKNFTLLLPRSITPQSICWGGAPPHGWRTWDDWLAVWGNLPPHSKTVVSWTAGLD